jgi:hypothetical protein
MTEHLVTKVTGCVHCKVCAEAEETVDHTTYNTSQGNQMAAPQQMGLMLC